MKQVILTLTVMLAVCTSAMAQESNNERKRPDQKEMIAKRTAQMAERYGLDQKQEKELQELNIKFSQSMFARGPRGPRKDVNQQKSDGNEEKVQKMERPSREEMEAQREKMKAAREEYNNELKKIMTEEQFSKYSEDMKKMMQRGFGRGNRGPRNQAQEKE